MAQSKSPLKPEAETSVAGGVEMPGADVASSPELLGGGGAGMRAGAGIAEGIPVAEPRSIHEIAGALLSPYQARDGQVRLAGCTLEARPVLRLGYAAGAGGEVEADRYFGPDGQELGASEVARAGLGNIAGTAERLRKTDREAIDRWIAAAGSAVGRSDTPLERMVIWSFWAAGKIVLQFRDTSVVVPFEGWARDFAEGRQEPPPFRCPATGMESYRCVALEDGQVTVAEALGACEITGAELPLGALAKCAVSGRCVDAQLVQVCAETGESALAELLVGCECCGRQVLPRTLAEGWCSRCRAGQILSDASPALKRLRGVNREVIKLLGNAKHWRGWIGDELAVVQGRTLISCAAIAFDPRDGRILRMGTKSRWGGKWNWREF